MDFFKSAVASAISKEPAFPYKFGDKVDLDQSIWTLHNGTKRDDGTDCSIFAFDVARNQSQLSLARNAVRKMRTLRHPGVIRVLESVESENTIYIATERVTPLAWSARRKSLSEETAKWGIHAVANTLAFINEEASSVHGNIRLSSVFISQSGEWRLGGFDVLSSMKEDEAVIYRHGSSLPDANTYLTPEVSKSGWETIKRNPLPAVDAYGFGILMFEVFNGNFITGDQIGLVRNLPPSMHQGYKRLMNANPKTRLSVSHFRDQGKRSGGFFETPLIKLSEGVDSLGLKNDEEREELLLELDRVSDDFPEEFFSVKVLPELLKSVEFGGGGPRVFSSIMKIAKNLSNDEWESKLTPVIVRLFSNPDRAIRVCLLDNLPNMIERFPNKIVNDKIFPQMVTGFTDVAPLVREQTVKAVLTIVTKLADRTINGELLKQLAKTSNDEQPGIRTNTTICMGKIARHLGPNTRPKVLIAAFSRSLRDPFVHARHAALLALAATADLFIEEDCATKVLPAICPSLVDKEKLVRDQANKALDIYMQRIRKYAQGLADTALTPSNTTTEGVQRGATPQGDTAGWTGWAISSFTNKISTATGAMQTKAPATLERPGPADRSSSVPPISSKAQNSSMTASASASTLHRQALTATTSQSTPQKELDDPFGENAIDDTEIDAAWGDFGDDSAADSDMEPAKAFKSAGKAAPVSFDDGGEPDFEGWLKAQAEAKSKSKAPLPKGLSKSSSKVRALVTRTATTGSVAEGNNAKKSSTIATATKPIPAKAINTKPIDNADGDDDWGDAWD